MFVLISIFRCVYSCGSSYEGGWCDGKKHGSNGKAE